jgi:hypothetical protein
MKKLLMVFATVALVVASAGPRVYRVLLSNPAWVNGTELKAGEYRVEMEGDKAVFRSGKTVVEAPAKAEENDRKYDKTSLRLVGDQQKITEIQVGGTNVRIVFPKTAAAGE